MRGVASFRFGVPMICGWRPVFVIAMVASVLAGISPKESLVTTGIAVASVSIIGLLWVARGRVRRDLSTLGLLVLMSAIVLALPLSLLNGISVRDYLLRGVAPLLFLCFGFLLPLSNRKDCEFVLKAILFACFCWAVQIAIAVAGSLDETLLQRWTILTRDLLFPFNLVAISLLLFHPKNQVSTTRLIGLVAFVILTIGGGYRIQLLIVSLIAIGYLVYAVRQGNLWLPTVMACLVGLFLTWFMSTESGIQLTERFLSLGEETESARSMEIKFAFKSFLESPLIGQGLPHPVPVEVAFYGREAYLASVGSQLEHYSHVAYVHNFAMYIMMNFGIVGLAGLGLFMAGTFVSVRAEGTYLLAGPRRTGALVACYAMFVHSLVAATFTLFPFNMMLSSLVAVLAARTRSADGPRELSG